MPGDIRRKRGRKLRDEVDDEIRRTRLRTLRGVKYVKDDNFLLGSANDDTGPSFMDAEKVVSAVISREVEILKKRDIQEIRESVTDAVIDDPGAVLGSPVAVRTMLCQLSVASCIENSFRQIFHATRGPESKPRNFVSITPECHILLSKACEQMIFEISTRAYIDAHNSRMSSRITSVNIMRSLPVISRRWSDRSLSGHFSFAQDVIDRDSDLPIHPLDQISHLHR